MSTADNLVTQDQPADDINIEKLSLKGEDEGSGEVVGSGGGGGDPAVLAVGPTRPRLRYTRDELHHLRNSPLSRVVPDLPPDIFKRIRADPSSSEDQPAHNKNEEKGENNNNNNTNNNKNGNGNQPTIRRAAADPRERVRRESETSGGIVLSPQRRSFVSGCGAPQPKHEEPAPPAEAVREQRRIGSGRILSRELSVPWERSNPPAEDNIYRPPSQRNPEQYERRSFGRDSFANDKRDSRDNRDNNREDNRAFDLKERNTEQRRTSSNRYSNNRNRHDEEPEWFSGGPTSQLETIELRGFDDPNPPTKNGKDSAEKSSASSENNWPSGSSPTPSPTKTASQSQPSPPEEDEPQSQLHSQPQSQESQPRNDFNFDEFLNCDSIPGLITNGASSEAATGSRFSRWFRSESPPAPDHLIHNILEDIDREEPPPVSVSSRPPSLMEMLQRANAQTHPSQVNMPPAAGSGGGMQKIHSLEELEANMRGMRPQRSQERDLNAFKRLLAQVSNTGPEVQHKFQPASEPHVPHDLVYQLLQVQQNQQRQQQQAAAAAAAAASVGSGMLPGAGPGVIPGLGPNLGPPNLGPSAAAAAARARGPELLARPEAQAILHGLKAGEITVNHIVQQLSNPGLQARHRELLLAVLRLHDHVSPCQQPAPLRLSPPPHAVAMPPRIPSPRELAVHTQSIMHGALIKKKLEEQRENYRRRVEMNKPQTPISFTPTSVLRKMTAEKEVEAARAWPHKMPQGRPIVKGNQGGGPAAFAPPPPPPVEFPPHLQYANQHLPQPIPGRHYPAPPPQRPPQMPVNSTLQQLLLQSHHRNINESGGALGGRLSPTSNQLARWFSPELLAQASAGKLPSLATRPPNALSLEELERRALASHN